MERSSSFSTPEVVGIATTAAAALGAVVVALGRSQAAAARARLEHLTPPATPSPAVAAERGREVARIVGSLVSERYPELRHEVETLLNRAVAARPAAGRIASGAVERAAHTRESGIHVLGRLQESVVPTAAESLTGLRERAAAATTRARSAPIVAVEATSRQADVALARSSSAAKETVAIVGWLAAASVLVYVVLLSPERREQVRTFAVTVYEQIRLLAHDLQGYEEEY